MLSNFSGIVTETTLVCYRNPRLAKHLFENLSFNHLSGLMFPNGWRQWLCKGRPTTVLLFPSFHIFKLVPTGRGYGDNSQEVISPGKPPKGAPGIFWRSYRGLEDFTRIKTAKQNNSQQTKNHLGEMSLGPFFLVKPLKNTIRGRGITPFDLEEWWASALDKACLGRTNSVVVLWLDWTSQTSNLCCWTTTS